MIEYYKNLASAKTGNELLFAICLMDINSAKQGFDLLTITSQTGLNANKEKPVIISREIQKLYRGNTNLFYNKMKELGQDKALIFQAIDDNDDFNDDDVEGGGEQLWLRDSVQLEFDL